MNPFAFKFIFRTEHFSLEFIGFTLPLTFSFTRNVLLGYGVHGYHDHNYEDNHQTRCDYIHNNEDHHHQDPCHHTRGGSVTTNHSGGGGAFHHGRGRFGARGNQRGAGHRQAAKYQGGVLQPAGDDGCVVAEGEAGHDGQDALPTWNFRYCMFL